MHNTREKLIELMFVGQVLADAMCDKQEECDKCQYNAPNACRCGFIADHLIANGVTVQEWISVKDRLPEKDVRVLVWMQDNEEYYTQIDTDRFSCTMEQGYHWIRWGKSVTHWMPLPEPPKGE